MSHNSIILLYHICVVQLNETSLLSSVHVDL